MCVYEGWERRQEAGEGGPQTKPFLELQRFRALDFHAALAPPDPALAFHLRERGCCRMPPPPTSGSCGIELEARFVRLRGPEPLLRRRLPPRRFPSCVPQVAARPAKWPWRVSRGGAERPVSSGDTRGERGWGSGLAFSPGAQVGSERAATVVLAPPQPVPRLARKAAVCVSRSERPRVNPESRAGAQRRRGRGAGRGTRALFSPEGAPEVPRCPDAPGPSPPEAPPEAPIVRVLFWVFFVVV